MDDKYKLMTLKYLYSLLDLKKYEKILEDNNLESIVDSNDFKYFTLLSDGDTSLFLEDELKELYSFNNYEIEELLSNEELSNKFLDFVEKTYKKYFFSVSNGDYLYYNGVGESNMAPDDAIVLGINYRIKDEELSSDEKIMNTNKLIPSIINEIQFTEAQNKGLKVAVIENNGLKIHDALVL